MQKAATIILCKKCHWCIDYQGDVGKNVNQSAENLALSRKIASRIVNEKVSQETFIFIPQIIYGRKGDHVGLILAGTENTDNILSRPQNDGYWHIDYKRSLSMADIDLLSLIENTEFASMQSADISSALILAIHTINLHVKTVKYKQKIYIISDGSVKMNTTDNESMVCAWVIDCSYTKSGSEARDWDCSDVPTIEFTLTTVLWRKTKKLCRIL